jgi:tetratricopeptide (TPR) repeat protein
MKSRNGKDSPARHWFVAVFLIALILVVMVQAAFAQTAPPAQTPEGQAPAPKVGAQPERKTADDLFKEGAALAEKNPGSAIRLFKEGLSLKPDALPARNQLAAIYQKQRQWGLAITEYETINRATASAESFLRLAEALARAGYAVEAAIKAEQGAEKYPSHEALQFLAGEQLAAIGEGKRAAPYLQRAAQSSPGVALIPALLGKIYEKEGKTVDAIKAYRVALSLDKNQKDALSGEVRLRARCVTRPGFIFVPPEGWLPSEQGMWSPSTGQDIAMIVGEKALPADAATRLIMERVPKGLYDETAQEFQKKQIAEISAHEKKEHATEVTEDEASAMLRKVIPSMSGLEKEDLKGMYPASLVCASYDAGREDKAVSTVFQCALSLAFGEKTISWVVQGSGPTGEVKGFLARLAEGLIATPQGR